MFITIGMPDPENRPPVDVCLTIDVSGSMGTEATLKGDKGETLSYGYSVLSVTVCAAKTIMNCLNEGKVLDICSLLRQACRFSSLTSCSQYRDSHSELR